MLKGKSAEGFRIPEGSDPGYIVNSCMTVINVLMERYLFLNSLCDVVQNNMQVNGKKSSWLTQPVFFIRKDSLRTLSSHNPFQSTKYRNS